MGFYKKQLFIDTAVPNNDTRKSLILHKCLDNFHIMAKQVRRKDKPEPDVTLNYKSTGDDNS